MPPIARKRAEPRGRAGPGERLEPSQGQRRGAARLPGGSGSCAGPVGKDLR